MVQNNTDYDLPEMWGRMSDEQKCEWYTRERVFRQACRQDTAFGRRYRAVTEDSDTHDTGVSLFQALNRCDKYGGDYRVK